MFEVKYNPNMPEQDHHNFIYSKGHKIPKHDNGLRYPYIDESGLLHVSKWEDEASQYGCGVYAVTDEIEAKDGLPAIDGKKYTVWGACKYSVYLSSNKTEKFHTKREPISNGVIVPHNDEKKTADLEILRQIYTALEEKKKEIGEE